MFQTQKAQVFNDQFYGSFLISALICFGLLLVPNPQKYAA